MSKEKTYCRYILQGEFQIHDDPYSVQCIDINIIEGLYTYKKPISKKELFDFWYSINKEDLNSLGKEEVLDYLNGASSGKYQAKNIRDWLKQYNKILG